MVFEKVRSIIAEQLDTDEENITMDINLMKDLDADSLDAAEIIMAIEDEFEIEIPDDQVEQFQQISNIVQYIEENSPVVG
jgi:acyl carrier protein